MLLKDLHYRSLEQEWNLPNPMPPRCTAKFNTIMRDKFIALDREKCEFVYQLLRATGAKTVVEAGTSFGVSTIYLALAVSQNTSGSAGGRVIATENEPEKARMAIQYWTEAGEDVSSAIDLRVGDLRETLKGDLGVVDFLLLDSEYSDLSSGWGHVAYIGYSLDTACFADASASAAEFKTWRGDSRRQYGG